MRIVLISDTHNQHEKLVLPEGEMIIHAGDVSVNGTFSEVLSFLKWFSMLPYRYKIFIAGNHDFAFENKSIPTAELPEGVIYLEDTACDVMGLKIYGSPYTPEFYNWAFMKKRGPEIRKIWENIPNDIDILITHGPPLMVLDQNASGSFQGCRDLLNRVRQVAPRVHVFGHIHEAYGRKEEHGIKFINAAVLDERYALVNTPVFLDL